MANPKNDKQPQPKLSPAWLWPRIFTGGGISPFATETVNGEQKQKTGTAREDLTVDEVKAAGCTPVLGKDGHVGVEALRFAMPWVKPGTTLADFGTALPELVVILNSACAAGEWELVAEVETRADDGSTSTHVETVKFPASVLRERFPKGISESEFLEMLPRQFGIAMSDTARDRTKFALPATAAKTRAKRNQPTDVSQLSKLQVS